MGLWTCRAHQGEHESRDDDGGATSFNTDDTLMPGANIQDVEHLKDIFEDATQTERKLLGSSPEFRVKYGPLFSGLQSACES